MTTEQRTESHEKVFDADEKDIGKEKNPPRCVHCKTVLSYWWECPKCGKLQSSHYSRG